MISGICAPSDDQWHMRAVISSIAKSEDVDHESNHDKNGDNCLKKTGQSNFPFVFGAHKQSFLAPRWGGFLVWQYSLPMRKGETMIRQGSKGTLHLQVLL